MPAVGFEPTVSAGERPQTHALHRVASGAGMYSSSYKYSNMDIVASVVLTCFWLKLIDMPLYAVCVVT